METKYSPSKARKYELMIMTSLISVSAAGGVIFIVLLGLAAGKEASDLESWLYLIGAVGFTIWMSLWARQLWRKLLSGIVVRESGLSIFGHDIPWETIEEVYMNPDFHYVSILLLRPYGITKIKTAYIRKESVSEWSNFFTDLERSGVKVKQENFI